MAARLSDRSLRVTASQRVETTGDFRFKSLQVEKGRAKTFRKAFAAELAFEHRAKAVARDVGAVVKQMLRDSSTNGAAQTGRRENGFVSRHRNQTLSTLRPFL